MNLTDILRHRRSIRKYTGEPIPEDKLEKILQAGLLSPSSRGICPWELIVVKERETLCRMAACRDGAASMLTGAYAAVAVVANAALCDVWVEDCAIVMSNMHLMADSLGVGSCWIQGRLRKASDGGATEAYLRDILKYPAGFSLEAVLSLGMPDGAPAARELADIPWDKIHREAF